MSNKTIIGVCVATYMRPNMLKNCLSAINQLECHDDYKLITIIVDNDVAQSGISAFQHAKKEFSSELHYFVEPERGIAAARNRLLKEAINCKSELIAFLDDDEFPKEDWLTILLRMLKQHNADVVTGPVVSLSEDGAKVSTTVGKYLNGSTPRKVSTNNVLFRNKLILTDGLKFDLKLNFTGGEDFDFFDRSSDKGNIHIWANEAIVYETIPFERTTSKYLFFRHFTGAINNVIQFKMNHSLLKSWFHFSIKALGKTVGAIVTFSVSVLTLNKNKLNKSIVKIASAIGYVSGLLNFIVERYR